MKAQKSKPQSKLIKLIRVESSMIYAYGYDKTTETLEVVFNRTGVYRYRNVPKEVYKELTAASSKGSYMKDCIIDCYPYERP